MPIVDEKTLTVATIVSAAVPAGVLEGITYRNPATGAYQSTPPTGVTVGQRIGIGINARNTGTVFQRMWVVFEWTDPIGVKTSATTPVSTVGAGAVMSMSPSEYDTNRTGAYTVKVTLHAEIA